MSVNFGGFNGDMPKSAQGIGGVNPNANPAPVDNENTIVNGGALNANDNDNSQPEGTTTRTKMYSWNGKNFVYIGDNGDGKNNLEFWRGAVLEAAFRAEGGGALESSMRAYYLSLVK